ncbi:helix-turn-helix transcriptional regulator [Rhodococcus pyridinivorans]|uniref:helix-turn-helix domain-containing protein n=1 Tax=Rhodococcus TaxID=1827 RepID=UPI001E4284F7|nr:MULTISPECIES: helix-turn-helix transcriptional regulator [Rhodococcus]
MEPEQGRVIDFATAAKAARVTAAKAARVTAAKAARVTAAKSARTPVRGADSTEPRLLRQIYGEILRDERRDQDRSLEDVARTVGMSKQYLSEVERGRKEASSEMLRSVCDALELPMEQLLARGIRRMTAHRTLRTTGHAGVELCAA